MQSTTACSTKKKISISNVGELLVMSIKAKRWCFSHYSNIHITISTTLMAIVTTRPTKRAKERMVGMRAWKLFLNQTTSSLCHQESGRSYYVRSVTVTNGLVRQIVTKQDVEHVNLMKDSAQVHHKFSFALSIQLDSEMGGARIT
ncbi:CLUMA_CG004696, isoform A [Clunio marinus]|uniref:CLUMA_CG004696, isoform A n=1 Tax=Clunio marinus TaxID=568069 RepID=A0A1J1HSF6_9DIPT|nr:CLUMA_CG004696, isoform A [Clunio marinus]